MAQYALAAFCCRTLFSVKLATIQTATSQRQITLALLKARASAVPSTGNVYPTASATWRMNSTMGAILVLIRLGRPQAARASAPMVRSDRCGCIVARCVLTEWQIIRMRETKLFFNAQVMGENGAATTTETHLMSVAITPIPTFSPCKRDFLSPR